MTTPRIEEMVEEYHELMKVHQSNMEVVEMLDKFQVEIRIPFLEDWLRKALTETRQAGYADGYKQGKLEQ